MKEFKLIKIVYAIVIGIFAICVGFFMSTLIQNGSYVPVHSSCKDVDLTILACYQGDVSYFSFKTSLESPLLTVRMNNEYVGEIESGRSIDYESSIADLYEVIPTTETGYICPNQIQQISKNQIPEC